MKPVLLAIFCFSASASCNNTKNAATLSVKDNKVYQLLAAAARGNTVDLQNLQQAYDAARQEHLDKIADYNKDTAVGKWELLLHEYESLQMMFDSISAAPCCNKINALTNFTSWLKNTRSSAAESWYTTGNVLYTDTTTQSVRRAYHAFEKAEFFIPGYKDAKSKMDDLYNNHVFINCNKPIFIYC